MLIQELLQVFLQSSGVSTDTRTLRPGELYFALKGPTFDGNQYAAQALAGGASRAIIDNAAYKESDAFIVVDDVLATLQQLARAYRETWNCPVIGLTGSNGKTTTKELMARALATKFRVSYTAGNLNNHIGVPLTLLRSPTNAEVVIIEMGANHVGEIDQLCQLAQPTHGLITNIGRAHLEGFGGLEGVRKGKSELYRWLAKSNGIAFYDRSDSVLCELIEDANVENTVSYVTGGTADLSGAVVIGKLEQEFPVVRATMQVCGKDVRLNLAIPGRYNYKNAAAALQVAVSLGVNPDQAVGAMESYEPTNQRSEVRQWEGVHILMDAYNANPDSMVEALRWLSGRSESPKLAILGELREMGAFSQGVHSALVREVEQLDGIEAVFFGRAYQGLTHDQDVYTDIDELRVFMIQWARARTGGAVLVKGSRGNRLERLFEH